MAAKTSGKGRREEPKYGKCYDCKHAYLMQSQKYNPVVALCQRTKERWVASMDPRCGKFERRMGEAVINPMIHLCKQD